MLKKSRLAEVSLTGLVYLRILTFQFNFHIYMMCFLIYKNLEFATFEVDSANIHKHWQTRQGFHDATFRTSEVDQSPLGTAIGMRCAKQAIADAHDNPLPFVGFLITHFIGGPQ